MIKKFRAVLVAAIVIVPVAADAAPSDDLLAAMAKCMAMTDSTARYACYDALAPQLKAAQSQPAPPPQPSPAETADPRPWYDTDRIFGTNPSRQTKPEQFGAEDLTPPAPPAPKPGEVVPAPQPLPEAIDSVTATVTRFTMNTYGRFEVFLDNGQVWKQLDSDSDRAYFHKSGGDRVVISRALLGSYRLVINELGNLVQSKTDRVDASEGIIFGHSCSGAISINCGGYGSASMSSIIFDFRKLS